MAREVRETRVLGPTPWVEQLAHDLEVYNDIIPVWGTTGGTATQQIRDMASTVLLSDEWWARYRVTDHEAAQAQHSTANRTTTMAPLGPDETCGHIGANGTVCPYTGNKRAVSVHKATAHCQHNSVR